MKLDEEQLSVVLQASIDHAKGALEEFGGFLPFGTRAKPSGEIEFLEGRGSIDDADIEGLYRQIAAMLLEEAGRSEIVGAAMVANASLEAEGAGEAVKVIVVQVETKDFCRSVLVPYRVNEDVVELGKMIPEEADPAVFVA